MPAARPLVMLVQLPLPSVDPDGMGGNVPLAAGYLKLFAERRGLDKVVEIEILPASVANQLGDAALVEEISARRPFLVGFTCYLWSVERSLWVAAGLKQLCPEAHVLIGGPEVTLDNPWVLQSAAIDYATVGEGEATFAALLAALARGGSGDDIPGVLVPHAPQEFEPRDPLEDLEIITSPYRAGILSIGADGSMPLETSRGCRFRCRFCYYPKAFPGLRLLSPAAVAREVDWARRHGVREVALLDPTLNERPDFLPLLGSLVAVNHDRGVSFSAELRAEGIGRDETQLLAAANVAEVEVGLQSVDPGAQRMMGRVVDLRRFVEGARRMIDAGLRVRTDLIVGLPGDTPDSVRRGIDFLVEEHPFTEAQVFHLSILPGTAFRADADRLAIEYQPRPPYGVLHTPTLDIEQMAELMMEAEEALGTEFDPLPAPRLRPAEKELGDGVNLRAAKVGLPPVRELAWLHRVDLDRSTAGVVDRTQMPADVRPAARFTLWLAAERLDRHEESAAALVGELLASHPHITLEVLLQSRDVDGLSFRLLDRLAETCFQSISYLDRYYSLHPYRARGAKRLVVLVPLTMRPRLGAEWIDSVTERASIAWLTPTMDVPAPTDLLPEEYVVHHEERVGPLDA
ncbi:MAG: B12-binding domain-containing radical SAM protein [Planctomycetota bacterium]